MQRVQGNPQVALLECTNPVRNKWRVRWDVTTDADGITSYMEQQFSHRPTVDEIKTLISGWISDRTAAEILSGFSYEGVPVWLSVENQSNYQRAYIQANLGLPGALPVTFKFGTDDAPVYRKFGTLPELEAFYTAYSAHIQDTQQKGWEAKDNIDLGLYLSLIHI